MKKKFIAIVSLMLCLATGSIVSYADARNPEEEKQVTVDEEMYGDDSYIQQDESMVSEEIQKSEEQNIDKVIVSGKVTIEDIDEEKGTFSITLSDIQNDDKISKVLMAVWCDTNGQDDLQWFIATKNDKNQYVLKDSVANHKYQLGKYNVDVYAITIENQQVGVVGSSFLLDKADISIGINQNSNDKLKYDIDIENINIPGGVKDILIPVWSDVDGQDDLVWYTES